ncbi:hypothetical protein GCM10027051_28900 [Niabella terrae]
MNNLPIKRHAALQSFSRDHHHGLLACWKLKEGLRSEVAIPRMMKYVRWFWNHQLRDHFAEEEIHIFPLLATGHPLVLQAIREHRRLEHLFTRAAENSSTLQAIIKELQAHIRFEERELFTRIQEAANRQAIAIAAKLDRELFVDGYSDNFWASTAGPK